MVPGRVYLLFRRGGDFILGRLISLDWRSFFAWAVARQTFLALRVLVLLAIPFLAALLGTGNSIGNLIKVVDVWRGAARRATSPRAVRVESCAHLPASRVVRSAPPGVVARGTGPMWDRSARRTAPTSQPGPSQDHVQRDPDRRGKGERREEPAGRGHVGDELGIDPSYTPADGSANTATSLRDEPSGPGLHRALAGPSHSLDRARVQLEPGRK